MIPGLENAEFLRYGVMHRNTFLNSPKLLSCDYSLRSDRNVFFAGQMTGVEGYIESAASGFVAGTFAAKRALGEETEPFPTETMMGAMAKYVERGGASDFQPMNANFGILPAAEIKIRGGKRARYAYYAERSLKTIDRMASSFVNLKGPVS